jgi:U6 snRNA-associated Sm-like protein LSm1
MSATLLQSLDRKCVVHLVDSTVLIGTLSSVDQFSNIVLTDTVERILVPERRIYAHEFIGTYVLRGENIAVLGEVDPERDVAMLRAWRAVPKEIAVKYIARDQMDRLDV